MMSLCLTPNAHRQREREKERKKRANETDSERVVLIFIDPYKAVLDYSLCPFNNSPRVQNDRAKH